MKQKAVMPAFLQTPESVSVREGCRLKHGDDVDNTNGISTSCQRSECALIGRSRIQAKLKKDKEIQAMGKSLVEMAADLVQA